ncbi:hypothetical protein [Burkholderia territorii]|uniref:hypothetical protein n=1 Tax=Burkholderia territorii TaxID=1503055 RepID=UPI0007B982F1
MDCVSAWVNCIRLAARKPGTRSRGRRSADRGIVGQIDGDQRRRGAGGLGGDVGGSLAGFSTTPEGKATVVTFIDAWSKLVVALRSYKVQDA